MFYDYDDVNIIIFFLNIKDFIFYIWFDIVVDIFLNNIIYDSL